MAVFSANEHMSTEEIEERFNMLIDKAMGAEAKSEDHF